MDFSSFPLILHLVRAQGPLGWQLLETSASGHLGNSLGVAGGGPRATLTLRCRILLASSPVLPPGPSFAVLLNGDDFYLDLLCGRKGGGFRSLFHSNIAACSQCLSRSSRYVSGLVQRSCKNSMKVKT